MDILDITVPLPSPGIFGLFSSGHRLPLKLILEKQGLRKILAFGSVGSDVPFSLCHIRS